MFTYSLGAHTVVSVGFCVHFNSIHLTRCWLLWMVWFFLRNICTWTMAIGQKYKEKVMPWPYGNEQAMQSQWLNTPCACPHLHSDQKRLQDVTFHLETWSQGCNWILWIITSWKESFFNLLKIWTFQGVFVFLGSFFKEKLNFCKQREKSLFYVFFLFSDFFFYS